MLLFSKEEYSNIRSGRITLAFRHWTTKRLDAGKIYKSGELGYIEVIEIDKMPLAQVTDRDARKAGYNNRNEFMEMYMRFHKIENIDETITMRICFRYIGENLISKESPLKLKEIASALEKIRQIDLKAKTGPWAANALKTLQNENEKIWLPIDQLSMLLTLPRSQLLKKIPQLENIALITTNAKKGVKLTKLGTSVATRLD